MCYDISYLILLQTLEQYFPGIDLENLSEADFSITAHILAQAYKKNVVVINEDGQLKGKMFEWGVIANYMNTPEKVKKMRSSMCNIRSEKIFDKQSYWNRIRMNRCLVPVSGFFEHREIRGWKNKIPYYVQLKQRNMFCIPGLYSYSNIPDIETGEIKGTFGLITRNANAVMRQIHNGGDNAFRMPLMLPKEREMKWIDPTLSEAEAQDILSYEMPADKLDQWTVYTIRTTKPHPKNGQKSDPFVWENLPPLGNDDGEIQKALF